MNIIISGWPGAGTTSLALILCDLLEYRYVYGGGVFKYLAQKVVGDTSGPAYMQFEQNLGPAWDTIWEPYALWKLKNSDGILLEGKTAGFFIEGEKFYEIMLIAKVAARAARAAGDGRTDAEQTILARDAIVRQRWIREFGIDIYNPNTITDHYDLLIDNSEMSIAQEVDTVLANLEEDYRFPKTNLESERKSAQTTVELMQNQGKDQFKANLQGRNLIVTVEEVLAEWRENFAKQVEALPPQLKDIVLGTVPV